jgi:ATP-binding cassette subfamily B protein
LDSLTERISRDSGEVIAVMKRIFAENGREYVFHYLVALACLLTISGTTALNAWIMRDVIDQIFYRQRADLIVGICATIVVAFVIRGLATFGQTVVLAKVGNNLVARYQQRLFDHLIKLGVGFFNETRSAHLAAQVSQNVVGIRDLLNVVITSVARDIVSLVGLVSVMIWQDWLLSLIALLIGPPLAIAVNYLMRRLRAISREAVDVNSRLVGALQETLQGITIVKAFTMEAQLSEKMKRLVALAENQNNKITRVTEQLTPIAETLAGFAIAGVIAYSGYRALHGNQPPGTVFSFITALLLAYDPARRLARVQVAIERSLVNARMIYEILDTVPHQGDRPGAKQLQVKQAEVRFEHVCFSYVEGLPVLRDVSFTAEAGKMTAIVGGSGAGKTTLMALMERFYDLSAGRIVIDDQDISAVTKESLRRSIAYVSQQPYLFEGSIRDNIRYGRADATDEEIEAAARAAQADDFIRQQPQGYETMVGENGMTLSGGQRQRLSIARAIVRNAPILVLDEATSALDNESEARVQAALAAVTKGRTNIVIAHRLSTVINADNIIVLAHGELIEQGSHRELIAKPHGTYARLYRLSGEAGLGLANETTVVDPGIQDRVRTAASR